MTQHQDRSPVIDQDGITITSYLWPGHRRYIPFSSIVAAEETRLGALTGRFRVVGIELRRMRDLFPWDTRQSSTSHALALDLGRRIRPVISPEDYERVSKLVIDRVESGSGGTENHDDAQLKGS